MSELLLRCGVLHYLSSDNGLEFTDIKLNDLLVQDTLIELLSP